MHYFKVMFFSLLQMAWVLIRNKVQVCCHVPAFPYLLLSLFSTEVVISHAMFESWIMLTHLWLQSEFGSAPSFSSSGYPNWNFCSYEFRIFRYWTDIICTMIGNTLFITRKSSDLFFHLEKKLFEH